MSDPRYRGGILAGIKLSSSGRWPETLPGLGARVGPGRFEHCALCYKASTFSRYGANRMPVCLRCARRRASGE